MRSVCVYCGARFGTKPVYRKAAQAMGAAIAHRGLTLVYGGGSVGLMGSLADAALLAGGEVIGVIPERMVHSEVPHRSITQLYVVDTMHERKQKMAQCADGFLMLPGGIGTLDETFEMMTWSQLGYHGKPIGILNVEGYYDPLLEFLRFSVEEGFLQSEQMERWIVESNPQVLLDRLAAAADLADAERGIG